MYMTTVMPALEPLFAVTRQSCKVDYYIIVTSQSACTEYHCCFNFIACSFLIVLLVCMHYFSISFFDFFQAGAEISTVKPENYAKRFLEFIDRIVE